MAPQAVAHTALARKLALVHTPLVERAELPEVAVDMAAVDKEAAHTIADSGTVVVRNSATAEHVVARKSVEVGQVAALADKAAQAAVRKMKRAVVTVHQVAVRWIVAA